MAEKPTIPIPDNVAVGMTPEVKNRFDKIDTILIAVIVAVVLALIAIIVSVFGIFLDQMRYNNVAYKEYSEKMGTLESLRTENQDLLNQNKQNQELIIKQQDQILKSIGK